MRLQQLMVAAIAVMFISQDAYALFCGKKCKRKKAKAKEHLANGGNCTDLRGGAKRKCKRQARKIARDTAKEQCASAGKKRRCRRRVRRDIKAKHGAYGFIGAKKANAQGKANWELFEQRKAELDAQLASGAITPQQHREMLKFARRQRKIESNRIGKVKTIKTVAGAAAVVATGGAAAVGLAGAKGIAAGAAVGAGAGLGVGAAAGANGASRNLHKMDAGYQAKMAQIHAQNGEAVADHSGSGYAQPAYGQPAYGQPAYGQAAPQAQYAAYGRNPAASSPCKRLPVGSCQRKMCRCSVGVKRASQGLPILNHTNKNGGPSINKICAQHARLGPQGAWQALKNIRPNFVGRCH